jgi:hypothetical protein
MPRCSATGLGFIIFRAGFNLLLEFLTGFTSHRTGFQSVMNSELGYFFLESQLELRENHFIGAGLQNAETITGETWERRKPMIRISISIATFFLIGLIFPLTYALGEPLYKALHPQGYVPQIKRIPLTPRMPDLNDKVVYIISSWPANVLSGFEEVLGALKDSLKKKYPKANIIVKYKESAYMENEPQLWAEVKAKADAFVYLAADSAATSMWSVIWSAELEKKGTAGVDLIFDGFINNTQATCDKLGIRLRYVAVPSHGQNINAAQMASIVDQVIRGLTFPLTDQEKETGVILPAKPPRVALEGTLEEIQKYFYEKKWTDGLPIIPPTEENVAQMLKGTSHRADEIATNKMMPEGWIATVEKVAINGVMAGCRPEHMPVLLATVEAFAKGDYDSSVR